MVVAAFRTHCSGAHAADYCACAVDIVPVQQIIVTAADMMPVHACAADYRACEADYGACAADYSACAAEYDASTAEDGGWTIEYGACTV